MKRTIVSVLSRKRLSVKLNANMNGLAAVTLKGDHPVQELRQA
jgi:hypothetical protein